MAFLKSFLGKVGSFFSSLFNAAQRTWNQLPSEVKTGILHGSGIVNILNDNIDKTPEEVVKLIETAYPDLTPTSLNSALANLMHGLNLELITEDTLESIVEKLMDYLRPLEGKLWAAISNTVASILSVFLAPPETKVATITSLMEFAYQRYIKRN